MGFVEILVILGVFAIGILGTVFWIWMLVDCARNEADTGNTKVVWVIIIAVLHFVGAAIYFFARRPDRLAEVGR
jgi:hypothetical protein